MYSRYTDHENSKLEEDVGHTKMLSISENVHTFGN